MLHNKKNAVLVCLGAGPKSIAIALLAYVLRKLGKPSPRIVIYERRSVGANWAGKAGFTDGNFPLDTSPFKDLGFPYASGFGQAVDHELGHFSFIEFLKAHGEFAQWVSRGKFKVSHRRFAEYLRWVTNVIKADVRPGTVTGIDIVDRRVRVALGNSTQAVFADGFLLTGPGVARRLPVEGNARERVFDGRDYWQRREWFHRNRAGRVAVIGGGQTAGTVAKSLISEHCDLEVDIINRHGFLLQQSSGYTENAMCSEPGAAWRQIPRAERIEILKRINNGVVESGIKQELDHCDRVRVLRAAVGGVHAQHQGVVIDTDVGQVGGDYDAVVFALGFDAHEHLRRLMPEATLLAFGLASTGYFDTDHALRIPNLPANIHVPALSGVSQGPGFMLLSCLGSVASRVVGAYVEKQPDPPTSSVDRTRALVID